MSSRIRNGGYTQLDDDSSDHAASGERERTDTRAMPRPDGLRSAPARGVTLDTRRHTLLELGPLWIGKTTLVRKTSADANNEEAPNGTKEKISQWTVNLLGQPIYTGETTSTVEPRRGEPGPVLATLNRIFPFAQSRN